jgi:hypothetical protein
MPSSDFLESPAAIAAIDDLLAAVGIQHGSRRSLRRPPPVVRHKSTFVAGNAVKPLQIARWKAKYPWLLHGFSTRLHGVSAAFALDKRRGELNLGFTPSDAAGNVEKNRERFVRAVVGAGAAAKKVSLVTLKQIHSSLIREVERAPETMLKGDALLTRQPGLLLGIQTADCVPVLVVDTRLRVVAAFHAGWRGTLARIVENGVGRMRAEFGSRVRDLSAAIGPAIGQCCYAVGEDLRFEFESQFAYADSLFREVYDSDPIREKYPLLFLTARAPGHSNIGPSLHLDLAEANRRQLLDAGLAAKAIHSLNLCTSCNPAQFFSHRAQHGFTGRMMSVIGVKP